jgi:hypothetical protein
VKYNQLAGLESAIDRKKDTAYHVDNMRERKKKKAKQIAFNDHTGLSTSRPLHAPTTTLIFSVIYGLYPQL